VQFDVGSPFWYMFIVCQYYVEYYTGRSRQGNQPRRVFSISAALASMHPILPRLAITIVAQAGHLEQL
jgi:hypothetical protein